MLRMLVAISTVIALNAHGVPAPGVYPKIVEEGQTADFYWNWGNGECRIEGVPGFSRTNGFLEYKSNGQLQNASISIKPLAAGNYEIAPRQVCRVKNGIGTVTENFSVGSPAFIRPSMFLCYPAEKGKPCPENKGIYWNDVWRFEFTSKNAERCEMSEPPNTKYEVMQYKDHYLVTNMARGGTGSQYLTWKFKCSNTAGTFDYEKSVFFTTNSTPINKNVEIRSFQHGDYNLQKTNLYWNTVNANSCSMNRSDGVVDNSVPAISVIYTVDVGYKYTLSCSGTNGSKASQTIDVDFVSPDVSIVQLYADNYRSGGVADLHWATKNASSCDLTGSNGFENKRVGTSGAVGYPVKTGATYILTCFGNTSRVVSKSVGVPIGGAQLCINCPPIEVMSVDAVEVLSIDNADYELAQSIETEDGLYKIVKKIDGFKVYKKDEYDRYVLDKELFFQENDEIIRSVNIE